MQQSQSASAPPLVTDGLALREIVLSKRAEGLRVGLAPTMGALHAGHLSLVEAAKRDCDFVVASVFVNPTQFAPGEDFERYPRDIDRDRELLASAGCDLVFSPTVEAMYPPGSGTTIDVGPVAAPLEGDRRPTHFRGVATVVQKLFNLAPAHRAYFGRKDYQQTVVIRRMVADLMAPIEVCICPIVRDADGLALSSRNAYLSAAQREQALGLSQGLLLAERLYAEGERSAAAISERVRRSVEGAGAQVEYVALLREGTVEPVDQVEGLTVVAIAAIVGETRLIDNTQIG